MGKPGPQDQKGLIPRSLEQVFESRQFLEAQGWKYEMQVWTECCLLLSVILIVAFKLLNFVYFQVSMLEIYNETIRDLLAPNRSGFDASRIENAGKQYAIKHDSNGNTHVSDLTILDVRSSKEVSRLLECAAQSRY